MRRSAKEAGKSAECQRQTKGEEFEITSGPRIGQSQDRGEREIAEGFGDQGRLRRRRSLEATGGEEGGAGEAGGKWGDARGGKEWAEVPG